MADSYRILAESGTAEIVEKKSRFIGYASYVENAEEAEQFIASIRKKHYDARHNCFAYSIGTKQPVLRFSDDGEPQGTAGKPILDVIHKSGISNLCVVVTRYFGGTLLGTGGLVRAYTEAAKRAVENGGAKEMRRLMRCAISTNYSDMGKIQYILNAENITVLDTSYGEQVVILADIPYDDREKLQKNIIEATAARASIREEKELYG